MDIEKFKVGQNVIIDGEHRGEIFKSLGHGMYNVDYNGGWRVISEKRIAIDKELMGPHIILIMQPLSEIKKELRESTKLSYLQAMFLICGNEDGDSFIFDSFQSAKKYQDDKGIDGRVVKLPIY